MNTLILCFLSCLAAPVKPVPTLKSSAAAKKQESPKEDDSEKEVAKKRLPKKGE
jgi:hypothetical protein